jgi:hypothetical protein
MLDDLQPTIMTIVETGNVDATELRKFTSDYVNFISPGTNSWGGVVVLVHRSIHCSLVFSSPNFLVLDVLLSSSTLRILSVYSPPSESVPLPFFHQYRTANTIIVGDFNAHSPRWNCARTNRDGRLLERYADDAELCVCYPSHATSKLSSNRLDIAFVSDSDWKSSVYFNGTSNHWPVLFESPWATKATGFFRDTRWLVYNRFLSLIFPYINSLVYNFENVYFAEFFTHLLSAVHIRTTRYISYSYYRRSLPPAILEQIKLFHQIRNRYYKTKTITATLLYVEKRHELHSLIRTHRLHQWHSFLSKHQPTESAFWRFSKRYFRKSTVPFQGLTTDTGIQRNPADILPRLYHHYKNHFLHPRFDYHNSHFAAVLNEYNSICDSMRISNIRPLHTTFDEVREALSTLQPKVSFDLHNNSNIMLKRLPLDFISILTILFNSFLLNSCFPDFFKNAKIICLSKTTSFPSVDDIRPISLLCVLGKLFERIISRKLKCWMHASAIIPPEQSGFQPQLRLATRVLTLTESHRAALSSNRPILTFYLDFKSAFDKISHFALLVKLHRQDIPTPLLLFFFSWLQHRTAQLSFGNIFSAKFNLEWGLPQGSALSPDLYILFISDLISLFSQYDVNFYADDGAIVIVAPFGMSFQDSLHWLIDKGQLVLNSLSIYCKQWLIDLNPTKTVYQLSGSQINIPDLPFSYDGYRILRIKHFRYLGYDLNTRASFGTFLTQLLHNIRSRTPMLKTLFRYENRIAVQLRRQIFYSFIFPYFVWAFPVFFYLTTFQQQLLHKAFCYNLKLCYGFSNWSDHFFFSLSGEYTLLDRLYNYWTRFEVALITGSDALGLAHQWAFYRSLQSDLRVATLRAAGARLNHRQLRLFGDRYVHVFELWFRFRVFYRPLFGFYLRDRHFLLYDILFFFISSLS